MRLRDGVTAGLGLAAVCAAVLAIGGALRWSQALVAVLVAGALAPSLLSRRAFGSRSPLLVVLGLGTALSALQLIPLPSGLLEALNPTAMALRADGAELIGASPWSAITLDTPGSLRAVAFFLTVLGAAIIALRMAISERGRYRILAVVAALCGVTAAIVWLHEVFGLERVYGLYDPMYAHPHLVGPLLNLNHLGCLMAMGAVLSIGLAMHGRQKTWMRVAWVAVVALCGALAVATVSRGATLALMVGTVVVGAALVGQRLTDPSRRSARKTDLLTKSLPIGIVAVCTVFIVIYSSAGNVGRQLGQLSFDELHRPRTKFAAWKASTALVEESPWFGVGRGAFETAFTRVYPDAGFSTFSHTENAYLQAVVDWGIPGAALVGIALVWFWIVALRRWRDGPLAAGALGALAVVAMQSNVDFGIELLGIALPATAIAATLTYVPLREITDRWRAPALRVVHVAGLAIGAVLLLSARTTTVAEDRAALDERSTMAELRAAAERHPLDYYVYAKAAQQLAKTDPVASIKLLNHALRLHPTHPGLHRIAARFLLRENHPAQAALEYAEAIRVGGSPEQLVREVVTLIAAPHTVSGIPLDYPYSEQMVKLLEDNKRPDVAIAWLAAVYQRDPRRPGLCAMRYDLALRSANLDAVRDTQHSCGDAMLDPSMKIALVRLLAPKGRHEDVIALLADVEDWSGQVEIQRAAWLALCDAKIALVQWDDAKKCVRRLDASGLLPRDADIEIKTRLDAIDEARTKAAQEAPSTSPAPLPPTPAPAPSR